MSAYRGAREPHLPPLIPTWDFQPIRLDNTPCLIFLTLARRPHQRWAKKRKGIPVIGIEEGREGGIPVIGIEEGREGRR